MYVSRTISDGNNLNKIDRVQSVSKKLFEYIEIIWI